MAIYWLTPGFKRVGGWINSIHESVCVMTSNLFEYKVRCLKSVLLTMLFWLLCLCCCCWWWWYKCCRRCCCCHCCCRKANLWPVPSFKKTAHSGTKEQGLKPRAKRLSNKSHRTWARFWVRNLSSCIHKCTLMHCPQPIKFTTNTFHLYLAHFFFFFFLHSKLGSSKLLLCFSLLFVAPSPKTLQTTDTN